jgi:hypothetical protein
MKANTTSQENQGIRGQVIWIEGNMMPGLGDEPQEESASKKGIKREIHIHELTNIKDARQTEGVFFDNIQTKKIKVVTSDEEGFFNATLPAGSYSVFVKENNSYFANLFDGLNNIHPVKVEQGKFTQIRIEVNYRAAY